ncbi:MAG: AI-2E family transporter [Acidimicrobiia bacterium]
MGATVDIRDGADSGSVILAERSDPPEAEPEARTFGARWRAVPWPTIVGSVAVVLAALALVQMLRATRHVLLLLLVAGFLAVILNPLVDAVQRRVPSRVAATAIVFTAGTLVVAGLVALFVGPLASRFPSFLEDLPGIIRRTQGGDGPVAEVAKRLHLQQRLGDSLPDIRQSVGSWTGPGLAIAKGLLAGVVSVLLLAVLTFMMLLEFPRWSRAAMSNLPPSAGERVRNVTRDIGHSVSGYMAGNLITSLISGTVMGLTLALTGVPYALVFAVWVALMGFVPQIGGLLAAVPTVGFAFLQSTPAGVITLAVFLVYQQIENHVLVPVIMGKTVRLRPLWVLVSVLVGAQLLGLVGALLAVPVAAAIQIVAQDLWIHRRQTAAASASSEAAAAG